MGYRRPKPGDLVLIRDFQVAKDKGRKLDARWSTPRILEKVSHSGVSAHLRQLHDPPGITKRYHFDDVLLYVPRDSDYPTSHQAGKGSRVVEYSRQAMGDVGGVWCVGRRAFDFTDLY